MLHIQTCAWSYYWTKNCRKSRLGRGQPGRGPWTAGLFLAKPCKIGIFFLVIWLILLGSERTKHNKPKTSKNSNFSLIWYSFFITCVDDQQVFPYNFHWQGFWGWKGNRQLCLDKFWLCLQCLIVSGVLRKIGPSLMPSQKQNGIHRKGLGG